MKKLVPNPAYEQALYSLGYIWKGGKPPPNVVLPPREIRTNNRNFLTDGMKPEDVIPSRIEVNE